MLWLWLWPSSYTSEWTPFKSLSTDSHQASRAFSDVINPTKNPNPRTWPTWLRSCLYRLVEPLTIKPIETTQLAIVPNNASLRLLKFLTCSFPNYPAPGFSQWYRWCLCLVCVCSLYLLFQCPPMFHRENHQAKGDCVENHRTEWNPDEAELRHWLLFDLKSPPPSHPANRALFRQMTKESQS